MAAPAAEPPPSPPIPFIDMTALTQSELRTLALLSSSSALSLSSDNIITPIIDRTIFNESAGSRRQTYSRPSSNHHRHRLPKPPNPNPNLTANPTSNDIENHAIIKCLKRLLSSHPEFNQLDLIDFDSFTHLNDAINFNNNNNNNIGNANSQIRKRKRGRKPKLKVLSVVEGREMEIVNRNGAVVDLVMLASLEEDPYKEELKRRTEGLASEEELLGFFRDLNGQWCSRRRKRRIVDASDFGDFLPLGWKLLLGLKRKEGKTWVYCRRYISPGGQHFVSCKEVSAYLQSFFNPDIGNQGKGPANDNIPQVHRVASGNHAGTSGKEEDQRQSSEHENAVALLGIENLELAEVQIHDLFECHKCNMTFDEKDTYLQHLLSFHQRTTRRYRLGSSVGDGVIVKDGKYECQFCHKVFHERRRYNGHVGIHVRNFVRGIEESPTSRMALLSRSESPTNDDFPSRISKMDALIEIAQNSIRETSDPNGEPSGGFASNKQNLASNEELLASVSDHELKSDSTLSEPDIDYDMIDESQQLELHHRKTDYMVMDNKTQKINDSEIVLDVMVDSSVKEQHGNNSESLGGIDHPLIQTNDIDKSVIKDERGLEHHSLALLSDQNIRSMDCNVNFAGTDSQDNCKAETDNTTSIEIEFDFGSSNIVADNNDVKDTDQQSINEAELQHGIPDSRASQLQPSHGISSPNLCLDKIENEFSAMDQRHDRISGFEELRLEDIEQLKFSFGTAREPITTSEVPINLENTVEMEGAYSASIQFESEVVDTAGGQQLTVCVWCGVEFSHEGVDAEMQSDSVGYMCPACKARISGQLNAFGSDCT